eukprot:gnl/Dysnectes_brevis/1770_a2025_1266.p1 GENE.gnl/Dysnectes_brevis/1770_a2025_1266~~gnl/Dysnectes_brevis/1770_a2025_1266.p1  ORF type:complete len:1205 (+),score=94.33 gnl/Dysnectes_brevis/1770_a2025_1266:46-3615(+)
MATHISVSLEGPSPSIVGLDDTKPVCTPKHDFLDTSKSNHEKLFIGDLLISEEITCASIAKQIKDPPAGSLPSAYKQFLNLFASIPFINLSSEVFKTFYFKRNGDTFTLSVQGDESTEQMTRFWSLSLNQLLDLTLLERQSEELTVDDQTRLNTLHDLRDSQPNLGAVRRFIRNHTASIFSHDDDIRILPVPAKLLNPPELQGDDVNTSLTLLVPYPCDTPSDQLVDQHIRIAVPKPVIPPSDPNSAMITVPFAGQTLQQRVEEILRSETVPKLSDYYAPLIPVVAPTGSGKTFSCFKAIKAWVTNDEIVPRYVMLPRFNDRETGSPCVTTWPNRTTLGNHINDKITAIMQAESNRPSLLQSFFVQLLCLLATSKTVVWAAKSLLGDQEPNNGAIAEAIAKIDDFSSLTTHGELQSHINKAVDVKQKYVMFFDESGILLAGDSLPLRGLRAAGRTINDAIGNRMVIIALGTSTGLSRFIYDAIHPQYRPDSNFIWKDASQIDEYKDKFVIPPFCSFLPPAVILVPQNDNPVQQRAICDLQTTFPSAVVKSDTKGFKTLGVGVDELFQKLTNASNSHFLYSKPLWASYGGDAAKISSKIKSSLNSFSKCPSGIDLDKKYLFIAAHIVLLASTFPPAVGDQIVQHGYAHVLCKPITVKNKPGIPTIVLMNPPDPILAMGLLHHLHPITKNVEEYRNKLVDNHVAFLSSVAKQLTQMHITSTRDGPRGIVLEQALAATLISVLQCSKVSEKTVYNLTEALGKLGSFCKYFKRSQKKKPGMRVSSQMKWSSSAMPQFYTTAEMFVQAPSSHTVFKDSVSRGAIIAALFQRVAYLSYDAAGLADIAIPVFYLKPGKTDMSVNPNDYEFKILALQLKTTINEASKVLKSSLRTATLPDRSMSIPLSVILSSSNTKLTDDIVTDVLSSNVTKTNKKAQIKTVKPLMEGYQSAIVLTINPDDLESHPLSGPLMQVLHSCDVRSDLFTRSLYQSTDCIGVFYDSGLIPLAQAFVNTHGINIFQLAAGTVAFSQSLNYYDSLSRMSMFRSKTEQQTTCNFYICTNEEAKRIKDKPVTGQYVFSPFSSQTSPNQPDLAIVVSTAGMATLQIQRCGRSISEPEPVDYANLKTIWQEKGSKCGRGFKLTQAQIESLKTHFQSGEIEDSVLTIMIEASNKSRSSIISSIKRYCAKSPPKKRRR